MCIQNILFFYNLRICSAVKNCFGHCDKNKNLSELERIQIDEKIIEINEILNLKKLLFIFERNLREKCEKMKKSLAFINRVISGEIFYKIDIICNLTLNTKY